MTLDGTLRALVRLASKGEGEYTAASGLARELGLSPRVLEQQFSALTNQGILKSRRGQGGGHTLARPPSQVTVTSVVTALQHRTLEAPDVPGSAVSALWAELESELERTLDELTLASLVTAEGDLGDLDTESYQI